MNDRDKITSLANILASYSRGINDQKYIDHFIRNIDTNNQEIIRELVSAIYDGLTYGNWPWIIAEMNKR